MKGKKHKLKERGLGRLLFGITARTVMTVSAVLLALSYVSMYFNPAKLWFMAVFGIAFHIFFILNVFLLLWALFRRSSSFMIPLLALIPSLFIAGRYIGMPVSQPESTEGAIKVISYNVGRFNQYSSDAGMDSEAECADSVFSFLHRTDADIICLQEIHSAQPDKLRNWLKKNMPGYTAEYYINIDGNGAYGNVTLSRYPAKDKGKFDFEHSSNMALYTDYEIEGRKLRVYNCHFESYNISIPNMLRSFARIENGAVDEVERKMRTSLTKRPEQVSVILDDIKNSPVETMVVGDFNDTPISYTYNKLKHGMKDSFMEAGKGMGGTYSLLWPFVRIDYVLFPPSYKAVSHKVERLGLSDHYPIITELKRI